jgi:hypothetical protein
MWCLRKSSAYKMQSQETSVTPAGNSVGRLVIAYVNFRIVAHLHEARTVEPEKQPLLESGSEKALISRQ